MAKYIFALLLSLSFFAAPAGPLAATVVDTKTCRVTQKLLSEMEDVRSDTDKLAALFKSGDEHIHDLISALDNPAADISLRAQIVIRYLGNPEGMKGLNDWYGRQSNDYRVAGPVPLPLSEWDYRFIKLNLISKPANTWGGRDVQYIYALALDETQESKTALDTIIKTAVDVDRRTFVRQALDHLQRAEPTRPLPAGKNLPKIVVDNAFFLSDGDQKQTAARLLGFNGNKDKALIEMHVDRGELAEEWYHVVLKKCDQGWKFFSITQVAIS